MYNCFSVTTGPQPDTSEFEKVRSKLQDLVSSDDFRNSLCPETRTFIASSLDTAGSTDISHFYLMRVLVEAKGGNYGHLLREAISNNYVPEIVEKKKPAKLTASQLLMIEKKRKKKMKSALVPLSMFPGNFRRMETELGKRMDQFAKENKGFAKLENELNDKNMTSKKAVTYVRVWGNPETIKTLTDRLREGARKAQLKMDQERRVCTLH